MLPIDSTDQLRTPPFFLLILFLILSTLLIACTSEPAQSSQPSQSSAPKGSCSLGLAQDVPDEEAIQLVIQSEGELVVKQQIDALMALWAEEGAVIDAKNTPNSEADDQFWRSKDAVRHRYVRVVFPGAATSITPSDLQITLKDASAVVSASTQIGNEFGKAGDRWQLVKQNGCWLIQSLTYNLEETTG